MLLISGGTMRENLKEFLRLRRALLSFFSGTRALIALALTIAALGVVTLERASAAGASPCVALSGVPCWPTGSDDSSAAAASSARSGSRAGEILPDEAPVDADRDAAAAEAEAGAAGTSLDSKAANSSFTFYNRNSSGKEIDFKFFSKTRNWVWPSATTYWIAPPDKKQYM